jgi:CHAT domain-containing protein
LYEQALHIREAALGSASIDVARTLTSLARTLLAAGDVGAAQERSARALQIWTQSGAQEDGYADALTVHASIQARHGEVEAAILSYREALSALEKVHGPRHLYVSAGMTALAVSLAAGGRFREAMALAFQAQDILREHLTLTVRYLSERQALEYVARRQDGLDVALWLLDHKDGDSTARVFDLLVRSRSLTLDEMAARHATTSDLTAGGVAELRRELISARQRLANLVVRGGSPRPEQHRELVASATRDMERLERELAERSARFRAEQQASVVGAEDVQRALGKQTILLSFYRYDPARVAVSMPNLSIPEASYLAFVVRPGRASPTVVRLGPAEQIDQLAADWRRQLDANEIARGPAASQRRLQQLGTRLRQLVWDPLTRDMDRAQRVFVVPDGSLNLVPFAALPAEGSTYLIETGPTIHYLSSERDLVRPEQPRETGKGLLALGAPAFERTVIGLSMPSITRSQQRKDFRGRRADCNSFQLLNFGGLPLSGREANDIARLWQAFAPPAESSDPPQVVLGRAADEASFKRMSPGHQVLHLATDGFFLGGECVVAGAETRSVGGLAPRTKPNRVVSGRSRPKSNSSSVTEGTTTINPLLLSGLALAGANRRAAATPDEEDGILTAEEVASLDLSGVEWAVLSACDTGLGEIKAGEGVFGLRRAFQIAGAHTVIMSLWSVEDRAAMTWMRALYEGRLARKLDTATAVREASLAVLKDRRAKGLNTHPFYWAGFVASGDWR